MVRGTTKNLCNSCLQLVDDEATVCPYCHNAISVKKPFDERYREARTSVSSQTASRPPSFFTIHPKLVLLGGQPAPKEEVPYWVLAVFVVVLVLFFILLASFV